MRGMIARLNANTEEPLQPYRRIFLFLALIMLLVRLGGADNENATPPNVLKALPNTPLSASDKTCVPPDQQVELTCTGAKKLILCKARPTGTEGDVEMYRLWSEGFANEITRADHAELDDAFRINIGTKTINITHMMWRMNKGGLTPLWAYQVSCQNGISRPQCLFSPLSSAEAKNDVDWANRLALKKAHYLDVDEGLPNELLFATLSGNKDAKQLLLERAGEFRPDGAVAEEWEKSRDTLNRYQQLGCVQ
jgi:hypothetical protein